MRNIIYVSVGLSFILFIIAIRVVLGNNNTSLSGINVDNIFPVTDVLTTINKLSMALLWRKHDNKVQAHTSAHNAAEEFGFPISTIHICATYALSLMWLLSSILSFVLLSLMDYSDPASLTAALALYGLLGSVETILVFIIAVHIHKERFEDGRWWERIECLPMNCVSHHHVSIVVTL